MIRKSDVQWWVLEAKKQPQAAAEIVKELAERLVELDVENERLREEVLRLQRRAPVGAASSGEVDDLRRQVATLQGLLSRQAESEPAVVLLSERMQAARLPLSHARRLAGEGRAPLTVEALAHLRAVVLARPQDELVLLTAQGHGRRLSPADVPMVVEGEGWPGEPETGDLLAAVAVVDVPPRFWTVVTRRGWVQQIVRIGFDRDVAQGRRVVESPIPRDRPAVLIDGDPGELLVVSRWGKLVRFPRRAIPSQGAQALDIDPDDEVAAALPLAADGEIVVVTASGYALRREMSQLLPRTTPGGAGSTLIQAFDVLGAFPYVPEGRLLFVTFSGKLVWAAADDVPLHLRAGKGSRVCDLSRDPARAVVWVERSD